MSNKKTLSDIEKEMLIVLTDGKSYWTKCYQLMRIVEQEKLFLEANYRSFTAWLNAFQYKAGVNVRILWQQKKAGSFYESYHKKKQDKNEDIPDIDTVKITPTNLVYIERIVESHPWLEDKLMKRAIEGNVTRRELKNTWDSIKAERIAKGEMVARETRHDKSLISATVEQKLSATKALLCIQSDYKWLNNGKATIADSKYQVYANYELEFEENIYQWDIVIAETVSAKNKDLNIHGMILLNDETSISVEHINEFRNFVDHLWIIVPEQYEDMSKIADKFGIIAVNPSGTKDRINVLRESSEDSGSKRNYLITKLLMKYLKNAE
ncbi:MAG: hypothetical protein Q4E53_07675 [Eubacteriales bacterium]|nr:hypothetical protein [Eubacteriales bacterium]